MQKRSVKKTRISGIIDHSSMGLDIGTEMEIQRGTFINLRKAFAKFIKKKNSPYLITIEQISGDTYLGDAIYLLKYHNKDNSDNCVRYEFKQQGTKHFLNVGGNPTCLISGANDIPVLITDSQWSEKYNSATVTFKYSNRIMYIILDYILEDYGFVWEGRDKQRLVAGDISITSYQVAWYSGDLASERNNLLIYLRLLYGGSDGTSDYGVLNIASHLNLRTRMWDNSLNTTVEAWSGDKDRLFSLTWYAKDKHPEYKGNNGALLSRLIRWDCTFNKRFMQNNNIGKVSNLENKYIELCDKGGYDIGFVKFMSDKVISRLKLDSIISINIEDFNNAISELEDNNKINERPIAQHWLARNPPFEKDRQAADFFKLKKQKYSVYKSNIEKTGINLRIPRMYYEATFLNRILATMSADERSLFLRNSHNKVPKLEELTKRSIADSSKFEQMLRNPENAIRIRKLIPKKRKIANLWILRKIDNV